MEPQNHYSAVIESFRKGKFVVRIFPLK